MVDVWYEEGMQIENRCISQSFLYFQSRLKCGFDRMPARIGGGE